MSHEATNWAFEQRGLKAATKAVLLVLCNCHNPDRGCFPSMRRLAEECGMSVRSVADHIRKLQDAGLVRVESAAPNGRGQFASNRYVFAFEADFCRRQDLPSAKSAVGKKPRLPSAKFADKHGKGEIGNTRCSSAHSDAHSDAQTGASSEPARGPTFGEFWQAWPLKRQGRARAEKAWRQLSAADRRAAFERVATWAERWRAAHPQASDIHPATFLNGKRWQDELSAPSGLPAPAAAARDCEREKNIAWFRQVAARYAQ